MPESFTTLLRRHCRELPPERALTEDLSLVELGVDSLQVVELIMAIEDRFGIEFPEELLVPESFASPGALWNVLEKLVSEAGV
ncbi:phosphopantetheine-binding protein [Streptosporangium carneum]|nr:phosphopantetheine-binding protein [Streptosporangium carneum]